jgi:hypothetical protein
LGKSVSYGYETLENSKGDFFKAFEGSALIFGSMNLSRAWLNGAPENEAWKYGLSGAVVGGTLTATYKKFKKNDFSLVETMIMGAEIGAFSGAYKSYRENWTNTAQNVFNGALIVAGYGGVGYVWNHLPQITEEVFGTKWIGYGIKWGLRIATVVKLYKDGGRQNVLTDHHLYYHGLFTSVPSYASVEVPSIFANFTASVELDDIYQHLILQKNTIAPNAPASPIHDLFEWMYEYRITPFYEAYNEYYGIEN